MAISTVLSGIMNDLIMLVNMAKTEVKAIHSFPENEGQILLSIILPVKETSLSSWAKSQSAVQKAVATPAFHRVFPKFSFGTFGISGFKLRVLFCFVLFLSIWSESL